MKRSVLVLIVLLVIAGGVATARFVERGVGEKRQRALDDLETIGFALDRYAKDNGVYPTTAQGLRALWEYPDQPPYPPNWTGPYLDSPIVEDPWGNPYVYRSPGVHDRYTYDLYSYGADGVEGGRGEDEDVVSWIPLNEL